MSNEVRIPITVTGEDQADRDLKKVEKAVERVGDALGDMGGEAVAAGKASEKAGGQFRETADDASFLARQLAEAEANVRRLTMTLDRTGDTSVKPELRKARRSRNEALSLLKEIAPDPAEATEAGVGVGKHLIEGVKTAFAAAPGPLKVALAGLAASAAPFVGAAVATAVIGGIGAGGIAGGIALASQDPAVQKASQNLAAAVSQAWNSNGATFVDPVVEALDRLATTGVNASATVQPGMDALAGTVTRLADGLDGLADGALPAVNRGLKAAAPIVNVLADELPGLGEDFGEAIDTLSEDTDGAVLALKALADVTGSVVKGFADTAAWLGKAYEEAVRFGAEATGAVEDVAKIAEDWIPAIGAVDQLNQLFGGDGLSGGIAKSNDELEGMLTSLDKAKVSTDGLAVSTGQVTYHTVELGVAADDAADALNAQREAMSKLVDLELAAVGGTIGYERALDNLTEARKENGRTLDLDTEKGRSNTEAILAGIEAVKENAEREYDLAIAHGATAQEAEKAAATYRNKFGAELKAQIIKLFGNTDAVRALIAELEKLNGKRITYTVVQKGGRTIGHKVDGGTVLAGDEGSYRRASGGPFRSGPMYWVGENGPELVEFKGSGVVHSNAASRAMASGGGAGGGGGVSAQVVLSAKPGTMQELVRFLLPHIQVEVLSQGGDVQEVLGARSR